MVSPLDCIVCRRDWLAHTDAMKKSCRDAYASSVPVPVPVTPHFRKSGTVTYHDGGDPVSVAVAAGDTPKSVTASLFAAIAVRDAKGGAT